MDLEINVYHKVIKYHDYPIQIILLERHSIIYDSPVDFQCHYSYFRLFSQLPSKWILTFPYSIFQSPMLLSIWRKRMWSYLENMLHWRMQKYVHGLSLQWAVNSSPIQHMRQQLFKTMLIKRWNNMRSQCDKVILLRSYQLRWSKQCDKNLYNRNLDPIGKLCTQHNNLMMICQISYNNMQKQSEKSYSSNDFFVKCKKLGVEKFSSLVQSKLQIYGSMKSLHRTYDAFLLDDKICSDQKWSFFKLMLSFDLFGVIDVLFLNSDTLYDYIERLYLPHHYTSLRSDANNSDDPEKIVEQIIEESYRESRISYLLEVVIGHHLDIKEQSLINLYFDSEKILAKYLIINNQIQQIHTILLKKHMKDQDFNDQIQNDENKFLYFYYNTSEAFKSSCEDFRLILQYEELIYEFQQVSATQKSDKKSNDQKNREGRCIQMLKLIQTISEKFKQKSRQIEKEKQPIKKHPRKRFVKQEEQYQQVIKIFLKQYKQDSSEILELIKLNFIKFIIKNLKIKPDDVQIFSYLVKLNIFKSDISKTLWGSLKTPILNLVNHVKNKYIPGSQDAQQFSLIHYQQHFEQSQLITKIFTKIENIFKQVDLLIASEICGNWKNTTQITQSNKILVIGKTKAGKSSLLNFLTKEKGKMIVGQTLASKTFYPEWVNLKLNDENWQCWDLPGLMDTRSFIFRLCIGFFLKTIVNSSATSKLKFLLVHKNYDIFELQSFSRTIKLIGNLLGWKKDHLKSLSIVLTHIQSREGINDIYNLEFQRMELTDPQLFFKHIKPIPNLSDTDLEQFFYEITCQFSENTQFFTVQDNKNPTAQSKSRELILKKVSECDFIQKITVQPIIFLDDKEQAFLKAFNIEQRAKQFLSPKSLDSNELFLKLFSIIQIFRSVNTDSIEKQYRYIKDRLKIEYQSGIHQSFVRLNQLNFKQNKNTASANSTINQILKYYLRFFFLPLEQKIRQKLFVYGFPSQIVQIIVKMTLAYSKGEKIQFQPSLRLILKSIIDEQLINGLINKMKSLTQNSKKNDQRSTDQQVSLLLDYFKYLIHYKDKEIISVVKDVDERILFLEGELQKTTTFKQQYLQIFKDKDNLSIKGKYKKFFRTKRDNYIQGTLLQIIEQLFSDKNKNNALQPQVLIEHFLQTVSKQNYQNGLLLDFKYNKLFPDRKIQNTYKSLRLNFYGQCISNQEVILSEFLKINTIQDKNSTQPVYVFSEHSFIKIYCNKFIFDLKTINIKCKQSFCVVADEIKLNGDKHTINAVKFNNEPATVIVVLQEKQNQKTEDYQSRVSDLHKRIFLNSKATIQIEDETLKIQYIKNHGNLISRTAIEEAVYLQLFYYDPNFGYPLQKNKYSKQRRQILRIKSVKNIAGNRPLQFGELLLKRLVQTRLQKHLKSINNDKKLSEQQIQNLKDICSKIITYIKDKFERCTVRLKYEHFNSIFCKKMALVLFEKLKVDRKFDIRQVQYTCYKVMKEQLFIHIFSTIINILEVQYSKQYGRHKSTKIIQTQSPFIKKYCENLLQMPLSRFEKQHQSENLNTLAKKLTMKFQKNIYYLIRENINLKGILLGMWNIIWGIKQTEEEKKDKLSYDPNYIENQIQRLKNNQGFEINEQKFREKAIKDGKFEQSFLGDCNEDTDFNFQEQRKQAQLLCDNYRFSQLITKFQNGEMSIFASKQDQIHSYIGYAYMNRRNYKEAANQFQLLPSEMQGSDRHKIILNILRKKYNSIQNLLIRDSQNQRQKKEQIIQNQTFSVLINPYQSECRSSLMRYNERDRSNFNILSFDSANHSNHIVNIVFAAEIQKCTHRPMMHMFDMIICKNSSALVGAALAIPRRTEKDPTYGVKLYPQFNACEFITGSQSILSELDSKMIIKFKFKPSDYDFRSLHTSLAIMHQDEKSKDIVTTFNYSQKTTKDCRTIYDIVLKAVRKSKKETEDDPLLDTFNETVIPALVSNRKIDVVSLGSGTYYSNKNKQFNSGRQIKRISNFNRWQVYLQSEVKMSELKVQDYIEYARMEIQQKWINQTKSMRDLMDRLEDKPTIQNIKNNTNA